MPDEMAIIANAAADPNCDPAKLRVLLAVKQTWEADKARKDFARDMAQFQSRCPIISKLDSANGRNYARIDRIFREIRPLMTECGFWILWSDSEIRDGLVHLTGVLGHKGGHTVTTRQVIPLPDEIRGTNAAQRAGSGQTYAQRYGVCAVMGVVCGDDNDGGKTKKPTAPPTQNSEVITLKKELWNATESIHGGNKNALRQWLIDDLNLEPEKTLEDLDANELKAFIQLAKAKLK